MDATKKKAQNKKVLMIAIVIILPFMVIAITASNENGKDNTSTTKTNNSSTSLSQQVDASLRKGLGIQSYTDIDAPHTFEAINGFSDSGGSGNVDIVYQNNCTKKEAKSLSKQIMGIVGPDIKKLASITVKCVNGSIDFTLRKEVVMD